MEIDIIVPKKHSTLKTLTYPRIFTPTNTHPQSYPISTSNKLSQLDLEIGRLVIDEYVEIDETTIDTSLGVFECTSRDKRNHHSHLTFDGASYAKIDKIITILLLSMGTSSTIEKIKTVKSIKKIQAHMLN